MPSHYPDTDTPVLLVVDDDIVIRGMLQRLLEEQGYQVIEAVNGSEAVNAFQEHTPDLVLMDAAMPVLDGFGACEAIKKLPHGKDTPVLMITALHDEESVDQAFNAGAVEYITKPIHWAVLRHRVQTLLQARRAEKALIKSEVRFRGVFEQSAMGIALINLEGKIMRGNPALHAMLGQDIEQLAGESFAKFFHPADTLIEKEFMQQLMNGQRSTYQMEKYFFQPDSPLLWARLTTSLVRGMDGDPQFIIHMIEDITRQKRAQARQRIASKVFETTSDGVMITNAQAAIIDVNTAFTLTTGYSYEEILDQNPRLLQSGQHDKVFYERLWTSLHETGRWSGEIWNRRKNGEVYSQWLSISVVRGEHNEITNYVGVFSDITSLRDGDENLRRLLHYDERMYHLTHYDDLTELPNRLLFHEQLTRACRQGEKVALLYIDLDNFRRVNDSLGYDFGDHFLKAVAKRLRHCARDTDTVARLEGDEFAMILSPIGQLYDARLMADKLFAELIREVEVDGHDLRVDCNIGISFYPGENVNPEHEVGSRVELMIQHADVAMYLAKEMGKNTYQIFSENEQEE